MANNYKSSKYHGFGTTPRVWIKIKLGHISRIILLSEPIDLDTLLVIQLRELARVLIVLGSERALKDG